jgi:hypothetical protein
MSKTIRHKTAYKTKTTRYKSNRYSGYDHFKMKPYGLQGYDYIFQRWFMPYSYLGEDTVSLINKGGYRKQQKQNLKNIIMETDA